MCIRDSSKKEAKALAADRARALAQELALVLSGDPLFSKVEAVDGYVNVYFHAAQVAAEVIRRVRGEGGRYGAGRQRAERVMVEYSQPNTHKAFHVGHLRNVCLGYALEKILRFAGYEALSANYIGDVGNHVMKCLWGYRRFHAGEVPHTNRGRWLGEVYAEAERRLEEAEALRTDMVAFLQSLARGEGISPELLTILHAKREMFFREKALGAHLDRRLHEDLHYLWRALPSEEPVNLVRLSSPRLFLELFSAAGEWLSELDAGEGGRAVGSDEDGAGLRSLRRRFEEISARMELWPYPDEVRALHQMWDRGDPDLVALWEETKQWSMEDFHRIYRELGVDFDLWFYESELEQEGKEIVQEIVRSGLGEMSEGIPVVKLDEKLGLQEPKYRVVPLLRSDGTSLYFTKDLALAKRKFEKYKIDRSIYVVASPQTLYFQQLFKVLELWGFPQAKQCYHLAYEIVTLPEGKMSSRAGTVVLYDDLAQEVFRRSMEVVEEKNPALSDEDKERISARVGLGAMKFSMVNTGNTKVIVFDWDAALNFDGCTAPYVQYGHARACRILEKAGKVEDGEPSFNDLSELEMNLLEKIAEFGEVVRRAAERYSPLLVSSYAYELARAFTDFYEKCPVLRADTEEQRRARLAMVDATRQTIRNALTLLGIETPVYM